jgi:hypothetical protein
MLMPFSQVRRRCHVSRLPAIIGPATAGVLIGAGIMMPLGHPLIGAGIGFIVQCILLCLFIVHIASALNGI